MKNKKIISIILLTIFLINFLSTTIVMAAEQLQNKNTSEATENVSTDKENINDTVEADDITQNEESSDIKQDEESNDIMQDKPIEETQENDETNLDNIDVENNEEESETVENIDNITITQDVKQEINEESLKSEISLLSLDNSQQVGVTYQCQGQDYGWQSWVSDGELGGTEGQYRRLEGIRIKLVNAPEGARIEYRVQGQDYGWQQWVSDGELGGTEGQYRRMEGIRIRLVNMEGYSVQYRVQGQDYGWQSWVSDGELGGTEGQYRRMEGIQIKIVKKQETDENAISIKYRAQGEDYGWQNWVQDGEKAGSVNQSKRLEGLVIKLENAPSGASIIYQAQGQDYGWQNYVTEGELAGTEGQYKRMEGIRIQLVNLDEYSVQYRAKVEGIGWQDWVSDGEVAGTEGQSKKLEAIQIKLVPKIKHSKVVIESPTRTIITSSPLTITGYALSEYENTILKLYLDSDLISTTRSEREDAISKNTTTATAIRVNYGGIQTNPRPGYSGTVDLSNYNSGNHTIKVQLYDATDNELLASETKTFTYYKDRKYGIDVSHYQGDIDWSQVKNSNVDFAMIRVGCRGYGEAGNIISDSKFEEYINQALNNGIRCGVYFFTQAKNREEGIQEANWVLNAIKNYNITYPVVIDTEELAGRTDNISVAERTAAVKGFLETIRNAGYTSMVYSNKYWLMNNLNMSELEEYDVWLAHYGVQGAPDSMSDYTGAYTMWQYTSEGSIPGISGNVDLDICYKEY